MRTLEEIKDLLKGSLYFAVFDSTKSFFHVPIYDAPRQLTAMLTPVGIYLYNVLAMGLSNATDIFESCMRNIVEGLEGVVNIADDVLVLATKYEKFKTNVISFLDSCVQHDLHLNPDKICINVNSVPFFDQTLTKHRLMMDENKWKAVQEWPIPTCIKELQLVLGGVNYLSKFIPFLSAHRKPLQELLKQSENDFIWQDHHTETFNTLKAAICKDVTLKYFDSKLPIYIKYDASKKGIGVVMLQPESAIENTSKSDIPNLRPVFYASKTLTVTESYYSNIEREMLGVVFSILHLKHFTFGRHVHIITGHKPLIMLFNKNLYATSPRLSQMLVQILDYSIEFHHQEGSKMHLSNALSCFSTHDSAVEKADAQPITDFNVTIHDVEMLTGFKSLSSEMVEHETEADSNMQLLKQHIIDGFPNGKSCLPEPIRLFYDCRECLTVIDGVIMCEKTIETLHTSHMGVSKTIERTRTVLFWPNMQKDIEVHLASCHPCAENKIKQKPEPLLHDVPMVLWYSITLDNFEYKSTHHNSKINHTVAIGDLH